MEILSVVSLNIRGVTVLKPQSRRPVLRDAVSYR